MKLRPVATSLLLFGSLVTAAVALRAADEKGKGKDGDVPPPPGTIKFTTAPAPVQKTFKDETKGGKIDLLGKSDPKAGPQFYMAIVGIGTNDYRMAVAEDGTLLEKVLNPATGEIKIEECPAPVMKTLKEEGKGAKVEGVTRVTAGKRADYLINVAAGESKYQIVITEDGTLMSKVMNEGEEEEEQPAKKEEAVKKTDKPRAPEKNATNKK